MALLKVVSLLFCIQHIAESAISPSGESVITLTDYRACKTDGKSYLTIDYKPGDKNFNIEVDSPFDVSKNFNINVLLEKMVGSDWKKVTSNSQPLCQYIDTAKDKFIEKIRKMVKPSLDAKCPWKKGNYKISKFPAVYNSKEYDFPTVMVGKFRVSIKVLKGKSVVACLAFEGDSALK